jgi:filamentous hemagglutinin
LANYNSVGKGQSPSVFGYDRPKGTGWEFSVPTLTGPFTRLPNQAEVADMKHTGADGAAFVSTQAGRVSAAAAAVAAIPGPHVPQAVAMSFGATLVELTASSVQQILEPAPRAFLADGLVDVGNFFISERYPLLSPITNEAAETIKSSPPMRNLKQGRSEP